MKRLFLLFVTVLLSAPSVFAQDISLFVAGTTVRLGMSKKEVLDALPEHYEIQQAKGEAGAKGVHFIHERSSGSADNLIIGTLLFRNNKLVSASKNWLDTDGRGSVFELVDTLYGVLELMERRGETTPTISIETGRNPGLVFQQIWLRYGKRTIAILIVSGAKLPNKQVTISEELSDVPNAR